MITDKLELTVNTLLVEIQNYESDTFHGRLLSKEQHQNIAVKLIQEFIIDELGYRIDGLMLTELNE